MRASCLLVIAACGSAHQAPPTISNRAAPAMGGLFTISDRSFGPITRDTPATLGALRAAFAGYDVRAANDSSLSYSVYLGDEKLVWVIPNEDGTVFNVHATSAKVETSGHDWRVGASFHGASSLTDCECWGDNPTCYRAGEHLAVNFRRSCTGLVGVHKAALHVLDGAVIQRVVWSPKPFKNEGSGDEM